MSLLVLLAIGVVWAGAMALAIALCVMAARGDGREPASRSRFRMGGRQSVIVVRHASGSATGLAQRREAS